MPKDITITFTDEEVAGIEAAAQLANAELENENAERKRRRETGDKNVGDDLELYTADSYITARIKDVAQSYAAQANYRANEERAKKLATVTPEDQKKIDAILFAKK